MSDDRDKELDELNKMFCASEKPGPHIEHPDEKMVGSNGLCWIDVHRLCGPDCVAFGDPSAEEPMQRCSVLSIGNGILVQLRIPRQRVSGPEFLPPDPMPRKA